MPRRCSGARGRLPGDPKQGLYLDLEAAREELGLPDDADPADWDALRNREEGDPLAEFVSAASPTLPHVQDSRVKYFELDAVGEAIDHSQVSAAAAGVGDDGSVTLLQSDQSFDEIAQELEEGGFERNGDVLVGESAGPEPVLPFVGDAGDGRIVVASTAEQAERAVAGDEEASGVTPDEGCITGWAAGREIGEPEVAVVLRIDDGAQADRVADEVPLLTTGAGDAAVGEPEVDGDLVEATVTPTPEDEDATRGAGSGIGGSIAIELYDCG
ncbi:MAG TPA: hypothetical protein VFY99_11220 [Solirubrobacterales bacterium]